jgi:hypothetical protein
MISNNHKNEGCGYAEELVSYLYGEAGAAESAVFEVHLEKCVACADELEAFSGARFSIGDWKAKEFDSLATPVIEIPYEKPARTIETESASGGWLNGLRGLFSLTPGWSLATASLAILAICVGIVLFALNARKGNDVAESNKNKKSITTPTAEKSPEQANVIKKENNAPEKQINPVNEQETAQKDVVIPSEKKSTSQKQPKKTRETQKVADKNVPKTNETKRNNKNNNDIPPSILGDEDEDDSLRLAELFEEIDTDE